MAKKKTNEKSKKYVTIHKFMATVALLSFVAVIVAGIRAGVSVGTISLRAAIVMLVIAIVSRIIIQVIATYEEMNSG